MSNRHIREDHDLPKITFIGAGSCVFTRALLGDILQFPELGGSEIALMDIDPGRLEVAEVLAHCLGVPRNELAFIAAVTNHCAWFTKLERKREDIYRAAMLDPLTSTNLTMDEIVSMCDELIAAHGEYLPRFEQSGEQRAEGREP